MSKRLRYFISAVFVFCALAASYAVAREPLGKRPVAIVGDSQHDPAVHKKIIEAIVKENPVAVFSLGDQVDDGESREQWKIFNETISPLRAIAKYYPALGNHEKNSALYYENFGFADNERWYTVEENAIRFIILDSNAPLTVDSEQYHWLKSILAKNESGADFIAVLFHHPLFTTSASHTEDEKLWRKTALPLFKRYRVDIVFSGHCHNYERSFYDGTYYIVSGGGGSRLYGKGRESAYSQVFAKKYHYCRLENNGGRLVMSVFDIGGALIDRIEIVSKRAHNLKKAEVSAAR